MNRWPVQLDYTPRDRDDAVIPCPRSRRLRWLLRWNLAILLVAGIGFLRAALV